MASVPKHSGNGKGTERALSGSPVRFALLIFALAMLLFVSISAASDLDRVPAALGYGFLTALLVSFAAGGIGCLSRPVAIAGSLLLALALLAAMHFALDDRMFDSEETLAARVTVFWAALLASVGVVLAAAAWGWCRYAFGTGVGRDGDAPDGEQAPAGQSGGGQST